MSLTGESSTRKTLRGGLIGCGFFARNHMNAWREVEGAEIVAVCDRDAGRAKAMAESFGIGGVYTDAEAMLAAERLDFVDIATTVESHRPLAELAARHKVAIVCQKPFAETLEDAQAMVAAAERAGVPLLVHENFRWQKPFIELQRLLQQGTIGKIHYARLSFRHGYDNYKNQPYLAEVARFAIMDVGLHLYDLARWLFGEVETVHCRTQRLNPIVKGEDAFVSMLGHAGGAVSVIDCSFYSVIDPEPFPQTLAWIEGDRGTLELSAGYRLRIHRRGAAAEEIDVEPPVPSWGEKPWHVVQDSVRAFEEHVVAVVRDGVEGAPTGRDNLKTLAVALASYESAERGSVVRLAGGAA
ncbi:Gfo/Idh/MocA family oxidoreductase [Chelativorans sp.]|uniref:Gfo/Idh/MocA family protein n=1 Tax=Chelativorans sp. TaxID=2203393 RepID=UPI00281286A1|nr:Gfo/Idh/MocA family oxidoreductase [Chelativorans sp.]